MQSAAMGRECITRAQRGSPAVRPSEFEAFRTERNLPHRAECGLYTVDLKPQENK
jgi:hypothetical protein